MLKVIYLQFVYFFAEIKRAIAELQLDKSAGINGVLFKASTKGEFVRASRPQIP